MAYLYALVSMGALGLIFGLSLGVAAKKLAVKKDPRVDEILGVLPGANCGACGFPGCSGFASAVAAGKAPVDGCPVGQAAVAHKVAAIMGVECGDSQPKYARVLCLGDRANASDLFRYEGIRDCRAAAMTGGGFKGCAYGCLGLGTCVAACPFDAIHMSPNGLPVVDDSACTGCGKCVRACPRNIIELRTAEETVNVMCKSHARGPEVKQVCKVGCIGCGICAKNCPEKAIAMHDNLAVIDQSKCTRCGVCVQKCPVKCIKNGYPVTSETEIKEAV
ncbi:MAG: Fe-S cluster domain-containing protein [Firmicutes bacterium]|jgi:electron transport complex protein RnfB|nr:Fe-S cluster domain-containing protein [Bacillota bacterium]